MAKINYDALFNTMTKKMEERNMGDSKDFLKLEVGSVVTGRLLLNVETPENSIYDYKWHGFHSKKKKDLQFNVLCPTTHGEECPICNWSKQLYFSKVESLKTYSKPISRRQSSMVNFYVINDNKHPENNGTVKILRYGITISKIIQDATSGENAESFGQKVWRLDEYGCNFKIKADPNTNKGDKDGDKDAWPTYVASCFLPSSKIEGMTDERQMEILKSAFDLQKRYEMKGYAELKQLVEEHYISQIPEISIALSNPNREESDKSKSSYNKADLTSTSKSKVVAESEKIKDEVPFEFSSDSGKEVSIEKGPAPSTNPPQKEEITSENIEDWLQEIEKEGSSSNA